MYTLLISAKKDTKWCSTLKLSTIYSDTNINKDGIDDVSKRKNPIKIVSYRSIVNLCGVAVSSQLFCIVLHFTSPASLSHIKCCNYFHKGRVAPLKRSKSAPYGSWGIITCVSMCLIVYIHFYSLFCRMLDMLTVVGGFTCWKLQMSRHVEKAAGV